MRFERVEGAFAGTVPRPVARAFDVVAADMDTDGDPDLLINWHHRGPMELFELRGGRFTMINARGRDRSGIFDNPGIPSLFADARAMARRIARRRSVGLHVWHDIDRNGHWRFAWREGDAAGLVLRLEASLRIVSVDGLSPEEYEREGLHLLRISLPAGIGPRNFAVRTEQITSGLFLRARQPGGGAVPVRAGADLTPCPGDEIELWKPDPHGMAWIRHDEAPRPSLFITRGGLIGLLRPPRRPKRDRFYLPETGGELLYRRAPLDAVPPDHSRGRQVEWVDVDGDGRLELSISAKASPNRLLVADDRSPRFEDRAASCGLDLRGAEVQCWGDHDGDGRADLYFLEKDGIHLLRQRDGAAFERVSAANLGLTLPEGIAPSTTLFNFASLRLADFDNDGDLDLWLLGVGDDRQNRLYRRDGRGFTDVSATAGFDRVEGNIFAVLLDVDNDGYEDVVSGGRLRGEAEDAAADDGHAVLWHNRGDGTFAMSRAAAVSVPVHIGTCLDVNGDGLLDVVLIGRQRLLLRNRSRTKNGFIRVVPRLADGREPVGAVVRVHYSDGRVCARRHGSAHNSAYSQVLGPLHFGVPTAVTVEAITVQWPGDAEVTRYPAAEPGATTTLSRG